jgi:serine/threonine protein phosphatase PrpC
MLVDRGVLDEKSAESSRLAHILASAVGGSGDALPTVLSYRVALEPDDRILLCTDGLTKHVREETMGQVASRNPTPTATCNELLRLALDGGGRDNIAIVVGRLDAST